jgi:hypothetical protein
MDGDLMAIAVSSVCQLELRKGISGYSLAIHTQDAWYVVWEEMDRQSTESGLRELVAVLAGGASVDITEPGSVRRVG